MVVVKMEIFNSFLGYFFTFHDIDKKSIIYIFLLRSRQVLDRYHNTLRDDAALLRGIPLSNAALCHVEAYPPFLPLQLRYILELQIFCVFCAQKSCITFVLWTVKIISSRLYFYEVLLYFNESPVAMRVISEEK